MGAWLILAAGAVGLGGVLALLARWLGPEDSRQKDRATAIAEHLSRSGGDNANFGRL